MNAQTGIDAASTACAPPIEDHSADFNRLRAALQGELGGRYRECLQHLNPKFGEVWRDMAFGYAMIVAGCAAAILLAHQGWPGEVGAFALLAVLVGYWVAYLQLFIHEASHYNIAATRRANDLLGDLLIGWMVGTTMRKYRDVHFQHHRALGTTADSEHTYFFALDPRFIVKGLTGWRAVEVLLSRGNLHDATREAKGGPAANFRDRAVLFGGIVAHAAIVVALYRLGGWGPALGWIAGIGAIFPFLGALRQLLEHRSEQADPTTDYRLVAHGACSRMFGTGPLASTFGGAGFNRHLLHHWEPQVSYTRLAELENMLAPTSLGPIIEARRTTYGQAFRRLYRSA